MDAIDNQVLRLPANAAGERSGGAWTISIALLIAGGAAFVLLFAAEALAAIQVWESSTAYNHCWLVVPIALWLARTRRDRLAVLAPAPASIAAILAVPLTLGWLAAERLGIMEGRQLAAHGLLLVFVLAVVGWPVWRAMAAPLLYLVFLVPFGAFAVPLLQKITARFIEIGLNLIGIANYVDDLVIETPAGLFHVAEACAGLRFSVAALAFGALYAVTMFRSPSRRLIVIGLALVVPVIANGLRALGIVVLAQHLGSAEAAAADHVIYGWGFFTAVILLLIAAGLPFREDNEPEPVPVHLVSADARPRPLAAIAAAFVAIVITASGPLAGATLRQAGGEAPRRIAAALPVLEGCSVVPDGLDCAGLHVTASLLVYPRAATWNEVVLTRARMLNASDEDMTFPMASPGGTTWRGRQQTGPVRLTADAAWLDGVPVGDGLRTRLRQGWNSIAGGGGVPVVVVVQMTAPDGGPASGRERGLLRALLHPGTDGLAGQGRSLSEAR